MPEETPQSRLAKRASGGMPLRGVGSGVAANQALAGVRDPAEAARMAALSPEQLNDEMELQRNAERAHEEKKGYLLQVIMEEKWTPPGVPALDGMAAWSNLLNDQEPSLIIEWHAAAEAVVHEEIDDLGEEELVQALSSQLSISADDPLYDPMQDRARRKRIEADLKPIEFEDMVFKGYVEQDIPLRENYKLTYRSLYTSHGLWIEWFIGRETESEDTFSYQRHRFSMLLLAASLHSINGRSLGPDLSKFLKDSDKQDFLDALSQRAEALGRMPAMLTDDLIVQNTWFNGRVRKLLAGNLMEKVGNS